MGSPLALGAALCAVVGIVSTSCGRWVSKGGVVAFRILAYSRLIAIAIVCLLVPALVMAFTADRLE